MISEVDNPLCNQEAHANSLLPVNSNGQEQSSQQHLLAFGTARVPRDNFSSAANPAIPPAIVPPIINSTSTGTGNNSSSSNAPTSNTATPTELRLRGAETYYGLVETVEDAILLVEACRRGMLPRVSRRLGDRDRALIRSGSIFVFVERESGIKRWTDGKIWSPSRITGEFLSYRQLEQRVAPVKRPLGEQHIRVLARPELISSDSQGTAEGLDTNGAGSGAGTLLKKDGLVKKTISLRVGEETCHLISYVSETGVDAIFRRTLPSRSPLFTPLKDSQIFSQVVPVRNTPTGHTAANITANIVSKTPPPILPVTRMVSPSPGPPSIPRSASVPTVAINPSPSPFNPPIMVHPLDRERNKILLSRHPSIQHSCTRPLPKIEVLASSREPYCFPPHILTLSANTGITCQTTPARTMSMSMVVPGENFHTKTLPRHQQVHQVAASALPTLRHHQYQLNLAYSQTNPLVQTQQQQHKRPPQLSHQANIHSNQQRLLALPNPVERPSSSVLLPPLQKPIEAPSRMTIGSLISTATSRNADEITHNSSVSRITEDASVEDDSLLLHHFVEAINNRSTDVCS